MVAKNLAGSMRSPMVHPSPHSSHRPSPTPTLLDAGLAQEMVADRCVTDVVPTQSTLQRPIADSPSVRRQRRQEGTAPFGQDLHDTRPGTRRRRRLPCVGSLLHPVPKIPRFPRLQGR